MFNKTLLLYDVHYQNTYSLRHPKLTCHRIDRTGHSVSRELFLDSGYVALLPIGIFILKASKIRFYGIQEARPIRDLRFKSTSKILFLLSFLVCVPYYWFRDSDKAYMIWSLN